MSALTIEDRYPLISQRGNFSGKASAFVKSIINNPWWRSDPLTGEVPDTVERNAQFHLNQGPVDMELVNAVASSTPSSINERSLIGTYLHRTTNTPTYQPDKETNDSSWREYFIWHVGSKPSNLSHSTIPTKY